MGVARILFSPFWVPLWFVWTVFVLVGRAIWFMFTLSLKLSILLLAIFGLIVLLWR